MEYLDLSPYTYGAAAGPMSCIGWLGPRHGLQGCGGSSISAGEVQRLRAASSRVGVLTLGTYRCHLCPAGSQFGGNGEFRYHLGSGTVFAAPWMIMLYVEAHAYAPPRVFLDDLMDTGDLLWDSRAERLVEVLGNRAEDLDVRCEAVVAIANWNDPRALAALLSLAPDDDLSWLAGADIGRSIGTFLARGSAGSLRAGDFSGGIRHGIDQVLRGEDLSLL